MIENINTFLQQYKDYKMNKLKITKGDTKYTAGYMDCKTLMVSRNQLGAEYTFSIGMPIYDENNILLGYLGIKNIKKNLDSCIVINGKTVDKDDLGNNFKTPEWFVDVVYQREKEIEALAKGNIMIRIKTYWQVLNEKESEVVE